MLLPWAELASVMLCTFLSVPMLGEGSAALVKNFPLDQPLVLTETNMHSITDDKPANVLCLCAIKP